MTKINDKIYILKLRYLVLYLLSQDTDGYCHLPEIRQVFDSEPLKEYSSLHSKVAIVSGRYRSFLKLLPFSLL